MDNIFNFGDYVEDKVTGFRGVVMCVTLFATGCVHYGISSKDLNNGQMRDWEWIDQTRLRLKQKKVVEFGILEGLRNQQMVSAEALFKPKVRE